MEGAHLHGGEEVVAQVEYVQGGGAAEGEGVVAQALKPVAGKAEAVQGVEAGEVLGFQERDAVVPQVKGLE